MYEDLDDLIKRSPKPLEVKRGDIDKTGFGRQKPESDWRNFVGFGKIHQQVAFDL